MRLPLKLLAAGRAGLARYEAVTDPYAQECADRDEQQRNKS